MVMVIDGDADDDADGCGKLTVYAKLAVDWLAEHDGCTLATVAIFPVSLSLLEALRLNALVLYAVQPGQGLAFFRWSALRWMFVALGERYPLLAWMVLCHFINY